MRGYQIRNSAGELVEFGSLRPAIRHARTWERLIPGRTHEIRTIQYVRKKLGTLHDGTTIQAWSRSETKKSGWHKIRLVEGGTK